MELLFQSLSAITPISTGYKKQLRQFVIEKHYSKHQLLIAEGDKLENVYFIKQGFAVGYFYNDGKRVTSSFWSEGQFLFTAFDFITREKSSTYIEFAEASTVISLPLKHLLELNSTFPEAKAIESFLVVEQQRVKDGRLIDFLTLKGLERYQKLMNTFPDLFQRIAQKYILSYLGITKETLSRYRTKKQKLKINLLILFNTIFLRGLEYSMEFI